jgi:uncharacterized membrane protein required for colicin V production
MVVPLAAGWIVAFWMGMRFGATVLNEVPFPILAAIGLLAQAMIACHYLRRLQERLKSRSFPLERASV